MFPTGTYDISANRYAPHEDSMVIEGYDFTGATLKMQVRDRPNGGAIRADITPTVSVSTVEGIAYTTVSWSIAEVDMEAMPEDPTTPGADVTLYYDVHLTPSGGTKFVPFGGKFIVKAGVTQ